MNELQKQLINIWKDVKTIIENSKFDLIPWAGTLLGAVRHGGFIPWDDDMDFGYVGSDLDELAYFLKEKLPKKYIVVTSSERGIRYAWIKIFDSSAFLNVDGGGKKLYKHPFIDIFNLLKIEAEDGDVFMNRIWAKIHRTKNLRFLWSPSIIPTKPFAVMFSQKFLHKKIRKRAEKISSENGQYIYEYTSAYYKTFSKSLFDQNIEVDFEDIKIKIPKGYDEILKIHYGNWHEIPNEKDRRTHTVEDK